MFRLYYFWQLVSPIWKLAIGSWFTSQKRSRRALGSFDVGLASRLDSMTYSVFPWSRMAPNYGASTHLSVRDRTLAPPCYTCLAPVAPATQTRTGCRTAGVTVPVGYPAEVIVPRYGTYGEAWNATCPVWWAGWLTISHLGNEGSYQGVDNCWYRYSCLAAR